MKSLMTIVAVMVLSLTACAQNKTENNQVENNKTTLVAYFSATGTTKRAAEQIAKEQNADLFEIEPVQPYTAEDLDWTNK